MRGSMEMMMGSAYRALGEFEEAIRIGHAACAAGKSHLPFMHLAATLALAGHLEQAQSAIAAAKGKWSMLSLSHVREGFALMHPRTREPLLEGLRLAGLAE